MMICGHSHKTQNSGVMPGLARRRTQAREFYPCVQQRRSGDRGQSLPTRAAYLELVLRRDLPLATLDTVLIRAAKVAGVNLCLL